MNPFKKKLERLKWSIYEWLGTLSVSELASNPLLARRVEILSKSLRLVATS